MTTIPATRTAVFPLPCGDVRITYPADMDGDGTRDLMDYLDVLFGQIDDKAERAMREEIEREMEEAEAADPHVFYRPDEPLSPADQALVNKAWEAHSACPECGCKNGFGHSPLCSACSEEIAKMLAASHPRPPADLGIYPGLAILAGQAGQVGGMSKEWSKEWSKRMLETGVDLATGPDETAVALHMPDGSVHVVTGEEGEALARALGDDDPDFAEIDPRALLTDAEYAEHVAEIAETIAAEPAEAVETDGAQAVADVLNAPAVAALTTDDYDKAAAALGLPTTTEIREAIEPLVEPAPVAAAEPEPEALGGFRPPLPGTPDTPPAEPQPESIEPMPAPAAARSKPLTEEHDWGPLIRRVIAGQDARAVAKEAGVSSKMLSGKVALERAKSLGNIKKAPTSAADVTWTAALDLALAEAIAIGGLNRAMKTLGLPRDVLLQRWDELMPVKGATQQAALLTRLKKAAGKG